MHLLSIDFSFFTESDPFRITPRLPWVTHESEASTRKEAEAWWEDVYRNFPQIQTCALSHEYDDLCLYIKSMTSAGKDVFAGLHHKDILPYLSLDVTEVTNIDRYHDMYTSARFYADSRNWASFWMEASPNHIYTWYGQEDSSWAGMNHSTQFRYATRFDKVFPKEYDAAFICLTPEKTPPHLWEYFDSLTEGAQPA